MMKKVIMLILTLAVGLTCVSVIAAAEWNFYGRVHMETAWVQNSKETNGLTYLGNAGTLGFGKSSSANRSDGDTIWDLEKYTTNFGVNVKAGDVSANVEFRPLDGSYVRHWNAAWNFGPGKILIGQWWSPNFVIGIYNEGLFGGGGLINYFGYQPNALREEMIELILPFEKVGTLTFATIKPYSNVGVSGLASGTTVERDTTTPKLEATFKTRPIGPLTVGIFGGYQNYKEVVNSSGQSFTIESWNAGITPTLTFGPIDFNIDGWIGQNVKNYGDVPFFQFKPYCDPATGNVTDAKAWGWLATLNYRITDKIKLQIGGGQRTETLEKPGMKEDEDRNTGYFLNLPIKVTKMVTIQPEFMYIDWGKDKVSSNGTKTDMGNTWMAGLIWKIDF